MRRALGVDIGGTKLAMVMQDHAVKLPTGRDFSPEALVKAVRETFGEPTQIGIAIPGIVDALGTVQACDVLPKLNGWNIPQSFPRAHVVACNDVDAVREEETHDLPPGHSAAIVMVGTAIGASFVLQGEPLRGAIGWAGELGYWPVWHNGAFTRLDDVAGGDALVRAVGCLPEELPELLHAQNPAAIKTVESAGRFMGAALAGLVNLLNPNVLVVGGGTWGLPGFEEAAQEALRLYALPKALEACIVRAPRAGPWCAARGALRLALREVGTG